MKLSVVLFDRPHSRSSLGGQIAMAGLPPMFARTLFGVTPRRRPFSVERAIAL
jgi:hypothetical protein